MKYIQKEILYKTQDGRTYVDTIENGIYRIDSLSSAIDFASDFFANLEFLDAEVKIEKISEVEYRLREGLSQSFLKLFKVSALYAQVNKEMKETKAMYNGTLIHQAILEPHLFSQKKVMSKPERPDYKEVPKLGKKADYSCDEDYYEMKETRKELQAENDELKRQYNKDLENYQGLLEQGLIITDEEHEMCSAILENLNKKPNIKSLIVGNSCEFETSVFVDLKQKDFTLKLKSLVDSLNREGMYFCDIKTLSSNIQDDKRLKYKVDDFDYDLQAFFYFFLLNFNNISVKKFYILFVEQVKPYDMKLYDIDESLMIRGAKKFFIYLCKYFDFLSTDGEIKGYEDEINILSL